MNIIDEVTVAEWNKMRCETALKLLALFYFADFFTTYTLIEYGDWSEGNPVMDYAIQTAGTTWGLLWAKFFFASILYGFYFFNQEFREKMQQPAMVWVLRSLVVMYVIIVTYSIYHITQIPVS